MIRNQTKVDRDIWSMWRHPFIEQHSTVYWVSSCHFFEFWLRFFPGWIWKTIYASHLTEHGIYLWIMNQCEDVDGFLLHQCRDIFELRYGTIYCTFSECIWLSFGFDALQLNFAGNCPASLLKELGIFMIIDLLTALIWLDPKAAATCASELIDGDVTVCR